MTTIALEQFPPAMQALFKAALHDTEAVITENAQPLARVQAVGPAGGGTASLATPLEDLDPRFRATAEDLAARGQQRQSGFAKGLVLYMAPDFNAPVDDFGDL